jgi:hypothetical protein
MIKTIKRCMKNNKNFTVITELSFTGKFIRNK